MSNVKFVVLGASGFIGSHLLQYLSSKGRHVIAFSRQTIKNKLLKVQYVKVESYNTVELPSNPIVFHLAESSHIGEVESKGLPYITENTQLTQMLLQQKPARFIYGSSAAVYKEIQELSHLPDAPLTYCKSIYGQTKQAVEKIVVDQGGVVVRFANIYGPGMSSSNIFSNIFLQLNNNVILLNEGSSKRDYLWIDDLVEGLDAVSSGKTRGIFNMGSGHSISCEELCKLILKISNKEHLKINYLSPHEHSSSIYMDIDKTKKSFSWYPKTSLPDGIKKMVEEIYKFN